MSRIRLVDHGFPFKKIMEGKKWIGRVFRMGDGSGYVGKIGDLQVTRPTEIEAFDEVGARYLGHASAAALRSSNRRVRQARRVVNAAADYAIDEMMRGNFKPLDAMLTHPKLGDALASPIINAATRKLLKP